MGTPHSSDHERLPEIIQRRADQGDKSAIRYLGLLTDCSRGCGKRISQAIKDLDKLYYTYDYDQDGGASYEQAREQLERQVQPLGFTISFANCDDIGAGAERRNYGAMRHVLLPRDRELEASRGDPQE